MIVKVVESPVTNYIICTALARSGANITDTYCEAGQVVRTPALPHAEFFEVIQVVNSSRNRELASVDLEIFVETAHRHIFILTGANSDIG